jgi:hypothetical protein
MAGKVHGEEHVKGAALAFHKCGGRSGLAGTAAMETHNIHDEDCILQAGISGHAVPQRTFQGSSKAS